MWGSRDTTPRRVRRLRDHEVFVFGSNADGEHRGGAARVAFRRFGALWGVGQGPQGQSYGIDTMSGWERLARGVSEFLDYAGKHPETTFLVTEIGCGIAGYTPRHIAPLFCRAPANVRLPRSFKDYR